MKFMLVLGHDTQLIDVNAEQNIYCYIRKLLSWQNRQLIIRDFKYNEVKEECLFQKYLHQEDNQIKVFYVIDNSSIKKQASIGEQYGYCNTENDEQQLSRVQIIDSAKSFSEEQFEKLQLKSNGQSQQNIEQTSTKKVQSVLCQYCNILIEENEIETPKCQHFYHSACLEIIIENELQQNYAVLLCQCKMKLGFQIMYLLDNKYKAQIFEYRFLLNQLKQIENGLKQNSPQYRQCTKTKTCIFFYLHSQHIKEEHKICPYCLIKS